MNQNRKRERLLTYVTRTADSDCWLWRGQVSNSGYGRIMFREGGVNHMESAHRASYEVFIGPLPEDAQIRQTCENKLCINPEHLEIVLPAPDPGKVSGPSELDQR